MADERSLLAQLDLALSQVKRVEREVRIAKRMIARLRDTVQPTEGHNDGTEANKDRMEGA